MATFEELILTATEAPTKELLTQILEEINKATEIKTGDIATNIDLLLDAWDESIAASPEKVDFCIELAKLNTNDNMLLRSVLSTAMKAKLPPTLSKPSFIRAVGLRDSNLSIQDIIFRFNNLLQLRTGIYLFQSRTDTWYGVSDIDEFSATVTISGVNSISTTVIPLDVCISKSRFFKAGPKLKKLLTPIRTKVISFDQFYMILKQNSLAPISEQAIIKIAQGTYIPKSMNKGELDAWVENKTIQQNKSSQERSPADARSIKEMNNLLIEAGEEYSVADNEIAKYAAFFEKASESLISREPRLFIETINLMNVTNEEKIKELFTVLIEKSIFWPQGFSEVSNDTFEVWSKIPVKNLGVFAHVTKVLLGENYLAELSLYLPGRCLNTMLSPLNEDIVFNILNISNAVSCDFLKWIWTNRTKMAKKSVKFLTMNNVAPAISMQELPSAWLSAQRELKKLLLNNEKFQELLLKNAGDDLHSFVLALSLARNIFPDEQQSLLVRMARKSDDLKKYIENKAKNKAPKIVEVSNENQPLITSITSHKLKAKELDNLLTVEIPNNVEAIAHARSYGDLKENSEYKAAKENQAFLSSRRGDLEKELGNIQPIDFSMIKTKDIVIIGSTISLTLEDNKEMTVHLVGVWDGVPEKDLISYKTRLGKALLNRKLNDKVTLPNGKFATITDIEDLSKRILDIIG